MVRCPPPFGQITCRDVPVTAVARRRGVPVAHHPIPTELTDQVAEAVVFPPDPHGRSVVIADFTAEMFEATRRLHGSDPDREELASLYRVLAEAYAHRSRMATRAMAGRR
jgi:hypothetical protein